MSIPTPSEAGVLLHKAELTARTTRAGASALPACWLTGMAAANLLYFTGVGLAGTDETEGLLLSGVFLVVVLGLTASLLPASRVSRVGFSRRWVASVVTWGVLFALGLTAGLTLLPGVLAYWPLAGALVALPLALGARGELRP
ncbi:hypothetical protein NUM3379_21650 [Kineococcus sp. NUM-3379]